MMLRRKRNRAFPLLAALRRVRRCCFFFSSRRRHTRLVSDWSSDVCSSDLRPLEALHQRLVAAGDDADHEVGRRAERGGAFGGVEHSQPPGGPGPDVDEAEIGRASWRERVESAGGAVSGKNKWENDERGHRW